MVRLVVAVVLVVASLATAGAGEARPEAAIVVKGTVTLKAFDVTKACKWDNAKAALRVGCTVYGAYAGLPGTAGAGYGWVWRLPRNAIGVTTHYGFERGTLLLDFGELGVLTLTLTGKQKPVGEQTAGHARVTTNGTWTMTEGTARLAGRHGAGRYAYTIVRNGPSDVFSLARVALAGRIVGGPPAG